MSRDMKRLPLERDMEAAIREAVEYQGGRVWAIRDSRKMAVTDMPDLIVVLPPLVALLELKSQRRHVTDGQRVVLDLLSGCTEVTSGIVRPIARAGEMSYDDALRMLGVIDQMEKTA
ncbi:MAG: hypothetical protein ACR2OE_15025 [Thermomicrobiales bacterium]